MLERAQATRGGRVKLAALAAPEMDYNHPEKVWQSVLVEPCAP